MKTEQTPSVRALNQRAHLDRVLELDDAAAADRRLVYEGVPWTAGGFREYLRGGRGLVALNPHGTVVGFAVFRVEPVCVRVGKFVAPGRPAHAVLHDALISTAVQLAKKELCLPLTLDLGSG